MPLIKREDLRQWVEVHVAGVCLRSENGGETLALIAKRNKERNLYPGKWECCGGQLQRGESFMDGAKRHFEQEMGIEVVPLSFYRLYDIPLPNGNVIPGIRFLCLYVSGEADSENHSEIRWVKKDEIESMDDDVFVPGIRQTMLVWMDGPFQAPFENKKTQK
jgi:8-oxo-dGTP pyrophosphatase MutT (NUDIX family)